MKVSTTIKLATYSCEVTIMVTDTLDIEARKIYKKHKINEEYEAGNEGILISPSLSKYFLLIDVKYLTHNTIAHEIFHTAVRVTEDRTVTDEEAQAWVCGHITTVMYKFLEKKKLEIRHAK